MARLRSGVRYRLKQAAEGEAATPSNDALAWLISRKPAWAERSTWTGPTPWAVIDTIARAADISPEALLKTARGDSELSQRMMAALVCASGERHNIAFAALFELVRDDVLTGAAA